MLGNCLSSCCSTYHDYDYEPLDDSIGNNANAEVGWGARGRSGVVVVPPTANGSISRQLQPFLTSGRGVFYGTMADESGERRTLGTRLLQHLRIYRGSSASGTSGVTSCSDPNPRTLKFSGKIAIGNHKSFNEKILQKRANTDEPRNPEQVILDQIVEEAAANMINVNQAPYSYLSVREVRTRQKFYDLLLNQTDPDILKKNRTTCVNLLTDCDFITRNRLMKFGDRCEGTVSWKDRDLLDWALKDLDEIVSCMIIDTKEVITVPCPDWTFDAGDNETQKEVPVLSLV